MRKLIAFLCAGETLLGTLDEAPGPTGLLIVSGGNEIRIGTHRGMALLAQRIAEAGHPVFRFDRRGIGDSTGDNGGFESSADDIAVAASSFRAESGVTRIVALGNCDAATALAFFHARAGIDALILANPWVIEPTDDLPPAAAIRARYAERLRDPREWLRLLRGGVNISKLISGLAKASRKQSQQADGLPARLGSALGHGDIPITVLLAKGDNTAIAFHDAWRGAAFETARARVMITELDSASHSFASAADKQWLYEQVLAAL
ncbi:hydrolase 1, exosortase A system-associated [Sphingomonas psychrotolerans]|uniref:Hydrolase 1, exosortase A system-associated n=1 Tax=Sphingomonas psychrotolerans TaxID=1327635 RepID=A0A2K8MD90_9SPHN|nr:hydrolase 1, exosortase A system-associated [Sphingomonas psychrotolerans]ATY31817.1 hydrolase 1, exosortase A system-associated [Sphingomonas psychrotolerans]